MEIDNSHLGRATADRKAKRHFLHEHAVGVVPPDVCAWPDQPHSQSACRGWAVGWGKWAMKGVRMTHCRRQMPQKNRLPHLSANLPVGTCCAHVVWDFSHRTLSSLQGLPCPCLPWSLPADASSWTVRWQSALCEGAIY